MKKTIFLFALLCLLPPALAMPSDGNYTLIQHDFVASGEITSDGNYLAFLSAGDPAASHTSHDNNYSLGTGFQGHPWTTFITVIEVIVEVITETMYIILGPPIANTNFLMLIVGIIVLVIFFAYLKRRKNKEDEEEEWYYE